MPNILIVLALCFSVFLGGLQASEWKQSLYMPDWLFSQEEINFKTKNWEDFFNDDKEVIRIYYYDSNRNNVRSVKKFLNKKKYIWYENNRNTKFLSFDNYFYLDNEYLDIIPFADRNGVAYIIKNYKIKKAKEYAK
jgi:hypothetical protein